MTNPMTNHNHVPCLILKSVPDRQRLCQVFHVIPPVLFNIERDLGRISFGRTEYLNTHRDNHV